MTSCQATHVPCCSCIGTTLKLQKGPSVQSRNDAFSDTNAFRAFCTPRSVRVINAISQPRVVDDKNSIEYGIGIGNSIVPRLYPWCPEYQSSKYKRYTLRTDSGENSRRPSSNLIIGGTHRLLYIRHRTFQRYRWCSCKISNKLDYSRAARTLNSMISNNCEASFRRGLRQTLLTVFVGETRINTNKAINTRGRNVASIINDGTTDSNIDSCPATVV